MKISYNKLQTFFDKSLPAPAQLAEAIIFHAFEVESIETVGDDIIMDIKILPDRAYDCLDEVGIAGEVAAILNIPLKGGIELNSSKESSSTISISHDLINKRLGVVVPKDEVVAILTRLHISLTCSDDVIVCSIPSSRPDITLPEHLIKEVGRIYGYDKVPAAKLPGTTKADDAQTFLQSQTVRASLLPLGFSEIYGYSFTQEGDITVLKPLQQDKPFLRTGLTKTLSEKINLNIKHNLFDSEVVKIFEIGTVFPENGEEIRVAVGVGYTKKKFNNADAVLKKVTDILGITNFRRVDTETTSVIEFPLSIIQVKSDIDLSAYTHMDVRYKKFSIFPRIVRDIALFVPEGTDPEFVSRLIFQTSGDLLNRDPILFDEFHKDGQVSLAFRLVFQSLDQTLTDEAIKPIIENIIATLEQTPGFIVRK